MGTSSERRDKSGSTLGNLAQKTPRGRAGKTMDC